MDKSCSWVQGEQGAPAVLLRGAPIPLAATFRQLGVDIAIGGSKTTGPVLSRRLEAGRSALRCLPRLSTYDRRERAISTLVTPLVLHGVAVAPVVEPDLRGLETAVVQALWGATACPGPRRSSSPSFPRGIACPRSCTRGTSASSGWPAWPGGRGVTQVFAQAIWESRGPPIRDGPGGARAPHGGLPRLDPARRLVVLGRPRARTAPALRAGATPPALAPGPGQPLRPLLALA